MPLCRKNSVSSVPGCINISGRTVKSLPGADSTTGLFNVSSTIPVIAFQHNLGFAAPNSTTNFGTDVTITPRLVATARFGYFFENYHDFGYPTDGNTYFWEANGVGAADANGAIPTEQSATGNRILQRPPKHQLHCAQCQ